MSRSHASLSAVDRNQEKVELCVRADCLGVLNKPAVNDATRGWVLKPALAVFDEERLYDPLVNDQEGDLGLDGCLVVALVAGGLELGHFPIDDLATFSRTHSISVDDDVGRKGILVVLLEGLHGPFQHVFDLGINNFLPFLLNKEV